MLPANIEVNIDRVAIKHYIEKRLDEEVREVFFLIDLKKMSELLCMSERYIEMELLQDASDRGSCFRVVKNMLGRSVCTGMSDFNTNKT